MIDVFEATKPGCKPRISEEAVCQFDRSLSYESQGGKNSPVPNGTLLIRGNLNAIIIKIA
jgi:hypothetical protein